MTTPPRTHRSTTYVKAIYARGRPWKPDPITDQFRFIVRMAIACHERNVPYDVTWDRRESVMRATITAAGRIPTPKPLPKSPCQNLDFPEGRNLGGFGRTLSEREDLIAEVS